MDPATSSLSPVSGAPRTAPSPNPGCPARPATLVARDTIGAALGSVRAIPASVKIVVVVATVLRIFLAVDGQYLFPDEDRYDRCLDFWSAVWDWEPAKAATVVD